MSAKVFASLNRFNLGMALLHCLQGIAVVAFSRDFSLPISTSFLAYDPDAQRLVPATHAVFHLSLPWLVAAFFFLSALFHLVIGTVYRPTYEANLTKGMNKARWFEYSLSASVMMVAISLLVGVYDLGSLLMVFALVAGMNLMGLVMEVHNQTTRETSWLSYWIGCLLGVVPWLVVFQVDLIYQKSNEFPHDDASRTRCINPPGLHDVANDKLATYKLLGEKYMGKSVLVDERTWREGIQEISTELIVFKPLVSYGGIGIVVAPKQGFDFAAHDMRGEYLAQEFLDSSEGIPGLVTGYHDLRLLLYNDEPRLSFIRQPKAGSYLANTNMGGSLREVAVADVPEACVAVAKEVDAHFSDLGSRFYAVDFMYANGRPYVVELNPQPGFPHPDEEGDILTDKFYRYLLGLFKQALGL